MGKRRFMGEVEPFDANHTSRLSNKRIDSHTRGWNLGIHVIAEPLRPDGKPDPKYDHFTISVTGGSDAPNPKRIVLEVWEDSEGIHVEPSFCPNVIDHSDLGR